MEIPLSQFVVFESGCINNIVFYQKWLSSTLKFFPFVCIHKENKIRREIRQEKKNNKLFVWMDDIWGADPHEMRDWRFRLKGAIREKET